MNIHIRLRSAQSKVQPAGTGSCRLLFVPDTTEIRHIRRVLIGSSVCVCQVDLDLTGPSRSCILPELYEDHLTVQLQGTPVVCLPSPSSAVRPHLLHESWWLHILKTEHVLVVSLEARLLSDQHLLVSSAVVFNLDSHKCLVDLRDPAEPPAGLRRLLCFHHTILHQGVSPSELA